MAAFVVPASLQNVDEAFKVGVGVAVRVVDGVANPGLSCEVDHFGKSMFCKQCSNRGTVRQIDLYKIESRLAAQDIQACPFQLRIIVVGEIIQSDNVAPLGLQLARNMEADETRGSRDQYCLIRHCIPWMWIYSRSSGPLYPSRRGCCNTPLAGYCQNGPKTIPRRAKSSTRPSRSRFWAILS